MVAPLPDTSEQTQGPPQPDERKPRVLTRGQHFLLKIGGAAVIVVALVVMLQRTWGAWPHILVDFGRELYTPWQISQGQRLYQDIASFNGPLSQHVNALVFKVAGASFRTLVWWNILVVAGILVLLHHAIRQVSSWWTAWAACLAFVLLFACAEFDQTGNSNYICPYCHEAVHGLALSMLGIVLLWQVRRRGLKMAALGGAALGLAFLTKAEVFLAGAGAIAVLAVVAAGTLRPSPARAAKVAGCFLAGAAVVPLAAWGAMAMVMPASTALRGVLGAMPNLFDSQIVHMAFYRMVMGTDDIGGNSRLLLVWSFYLGLFVVVLAGAALACTGPAQKHRSTSLWLGAAVALGLWVFRGDIGSGWIEMARPLPLVMLVAGLVLLASACRARHDPLLAERRLRQLSLVAFAGLLLLKIVLNTRIFDYGFILAMPACLLVVVILLEWIPRAVTRMGGTGLVFAAPALGALAVAVAAYLTVQTHLKVLKTHPVADPRGGVIVSDEYGAMFNRILDQLRSTARPGQTLVVLPEGVMVNYLAGLRNPTPYITCAPLEMKMFSQGRVLDAFRSHPPDFIVLMPTDLSLWGYRRFRDYAPDLDAWITANYGTAWQASVTIRDKKQTCVLLRKLP